MEKISNKVFLVNSSALGAVSYSCFIFGACVVLNLFYSEIAAVFNEGLGAKVVVVIDVKFKGFLLRL